MHAHKSVAETKLILKKALKGISAIIDIMKIAAQSIAKSISLDSSVTVVHPLFCSVSKFYSTGQFFSLMSFGAPGGRGAPVH